MISVDKAIEFLEELKTIIQDDDNNLNMTDYGYKKMDMTIDLLKSLKDENKKLKRENEAYKGIVEEIANDFGDGILQNENGFGIKLEHLIEIKKEKYLGGVE